MYCIIICSADREEMKGREKTIDIDKQFDKERVKINTDEYSFITPWK